ncbi:MAG: protein-export chaperone SecB [Pseudomonadota bacterium]
MSDTPPQPPADGPASDAEPAANGGQPVLRVLTQYLKDLSFESPAAPGALAANLPAPNMEVSVDVNARGLGQNRYEVELSCSATARREGDVAYVVEANYAGLFHIENVPMEQMEPVLLIDGPALLFPFIRQIIAQATRDGGFAPLMLEPLDFLGMYQAQKAKQAQNEVPTAAPSELM